MARTGNPQGSAALTFKTFNGHETRSPHHSRFLSKGYDVIYRHNLCFCPRRNRICIDIFIRVFTGSYITVIGSTTMLKNAAEKLRILPGVGQMYNDRKTNDI